MIRSSTLVLASMLGCLLIAWQENPTSPELRKLGRTVCFARPITLPPSPVRVVERIDPDRTVAAILASRSQTYVFPMEADRDRLAELLDFLPKARASKITVWVRILPPTLGADMKPHLGDYRAWAREIARIGAKHANLVALYIPDLDYGLNQRTLGADTLAAMRKTLHGSGIRLVAGLFDPTPRLWGRLRNELDGVVCTWVQTKELRNLATFLAGSRAMTPKQIPVLAGYPCKGLAPGNQVFAPDFLGFAIRHALRTVDGVYLRDFVFRARCEDPVDKKRFEIASKAFLGVKKD